MLALAVLTFVMFKRPAVAPTNTGVTPSFLTTTFTEIRTPTLVGSVPQNNEFLSVSPNSVSLMFKEALQPNSTLAVTDPDGVPAHLGRATYSEDRLTMTALLRRGVSGPLKVTYTACPLNGSCATGLFGFSIRRP